MASPPTNTISWFPNQGGGSFASSRQITSAVDSPRSVDTGT